MVGFSTYITLREIIYVDRVGYFKNMFSNVRHVR